MNTRIVIAVLGTALSAHLVVAQMGGYGSGMSQSQAPKSSGGQSQQDAGTTSATTSPVGVKGYLDSLMASSKDKKFHLTYDGKDIGLTPVKFHQEKKLGGGKSSTAVEMKGADGKLYQVDFLSSGGQPTGAKIHPLTATH